jgi:hypothetical protein
MSVTVLRAIDEDIQMRKNAIEQFNASIQVELNTIEQLKASIQTELNAIQDLETARKTVIKVMPVIVPDVHVVQVETLSEKPIVPAVQVETVAVKAISHDVPVKKSSKKTIVAKDSLSPDDYSSVDKKPKVLSNDKKLTDCDFDIHHLFDVKCIHKEKGKALYNLYDNGQLLHWINDKDEYSSTYMSGTQFTPFGPHNDDPFKASLFGRVNSKIKGKIYFGTQSDPISKKTYAKTFEQTFEQTSEQTSAGTPELNMNDESVFPSL